MTPWSLLFPCEGNVRRNNALVPYEEITRFRRSWPWWRCTLTGLSTLALALSVILSWHDLEGGSVVGCGGPGAPGCDQVLNSRWATIAGILPVSGLAAGAYLSILISSFFIGPATDAPVRRLAWGVMLILVGSAAGSAVWFSIVQKWIIGAFCPFCMTTHIIGLLLAVLVIWRANSPFDNESTDCGFRISDFGFRSRSDSRFQSAIRNRKSAIGLALVGLALAGILATCQLVFTPPAVYLDGESQDNQIVIDPHDALLVGSPDAPCVVTLLFDYQCPHCQQMHFMLNEVIRRYDGKLAFALCPAPLNTRCNPYIHRDVDEYKDSCDLVKIGLAVWVANRDAFPAFENWMFTFESGDRWRPRSLDAARVKAVELVGQAKLDSALANPWIEQYMQTSIRIYGQTFKSGNGGIPKLVFGSRWVIPQPSNANDLVMILQNSLAVPKP
jgi:uncharacterized membrane protein